MEWDWHETIEIMITQARWCWLFQSRICQRGMKNITEREDHSVFIRMIKCQQYNAQWYPKQCRIQPFYFLIKKKYCSRQTVLLLFFRIKLLLKKVALKVKFQIITMSASISVAIVDTGLSEQEVRKYVIGYFRYWSIKTVKVSRSRRNWSLQ